MNRFTLIITLCAFVAGFLVNEYRHTQHASHVDTHALAPTLPSQPAQKPIQRLVPDAPVIHPENTAASQPDVSWDHINQLIAQSRFNEAVALLHRYLQHTPNSRQAWLLLAQSYEKLDNHEAALDAWFRYLHYEIDALKVEQTIATIRSYLMRLYSKQGLFNNNTDWLISQLNELLEFNSNDAELHVMLASLYARLEDHYQAQYHAMMAANDPSVQTRAETILAELSGASIPDELSVPLVRFGNQYLVNVSIEGYPARLLLDTGASLSGVSNTFTNKHPSLVKSTKPIRLNTASGTVDSVLFTVDTLRINELAFNQHILALLPVSNMTHFDGLLGVDILGRFDFVIDQDALQLRLRARGK